MTENDDFKTIYEPVLISVKSVKYSVSMLETSLSYVLWDEVKKLRGAEPVNTNFSVLEFGAQGENCICLFVTSKGTTQLSHFFLRKH